MNHVTVSDVGRRYGVPPRVISDLFYARKLDDRRCPIVGGRRLIPEDYLPEIESTCEPPAICTTKRGCSVSANQSLGVHETAWNQEPAAGLTVRDVARRLRVGEDKVRTWIRNGEIRAINTARSLCARPRWVVPREALERFEQRRAGVPPPTPPRRRRRPATTDYYPD